VSVTPSEKNDLTWPPFFGRLHRLPRNSLLAREVLLGVFVLTTAAIVLPIGWSVSGNSSGFVAGAAAGGVCLLASCIALASSEPLRRPRQILALVLVGMLVRMGIPLAAALTVYFAGGPLADAGFLYYLVLFYPLTLTVETFLSWPECGLQEKNVPPAHNFVG
jgi:hypothetical protein